MILSLKYSWYFCRQLVPNDKWICVLHLIDFLKQRIFSIAFGVNRILMFLLNCTHISGCAADVCYSRTDGLFVFFLPSFFFFLLILLENVFWQIKIVYIEGLQCDGLIYAYIVKWLPHIHHHMVTILWGWWREQLNIYSLAASKTVLLME